MTYEATMTSKGQLTLPKALRDALGLKPGDKVRFEQTPDGDVHVIAKTLKFADLRGMFAAGGPPPTNDEIVAMVAAARKARAQKILDQIEE